MLTDEKDLVVDPFAGSCVTGEVCERLNRRWCCIELLEEYLEGAVGRFQKDSLVNGRFNGKSSEEDPSNYYRVPRPGILWNGSTGNPLPADGGESRPQPSKTPGTDQARKRT